MSPAVEGRFLTTGPPGKSLLYFVVSYYLLGVVCYTAIVTDFGAGGEVLNMKTGLRRVGLALGLSQTQLRAQGTGGDLIIV